MERWRDISTAQDIPNGMRADLRMKSGREVRAIWEQRGNCTAWWPEEGQQRRRMIGLYDPMEWRPVEDIRPAGKLLLFTGVRVA